MCKCLFSLGFILLFVFNGLAGGSTSTCKCLKLLGFILLFVVNCLAGEVGSPSKSLFSQEKTPPC